MALGQTLEDANGTHHAMLGLLGLETSFAKRRMQLGYRRARLVVDCSIGRKDSVIAGHEFHYATTVASPDEKLAVVTDADGNAVAEGGSRRGHITGSFFHMVDQL